MLRASNNDRIMSFVNKMSFPTDYVPLTSHFERDYISRKARHTKYGNTGVDPDKIEEIPMEQAKALYRTDTDPWTRLDIHTAGKSKRKYAHQQTLDGVAKDEITYQLVHNSTLLSTVIRSLDEANLNTDGVKIQNHIKDKTGASFWTSLSFPQYRVDIPTSNGKVRSQNARVDIRNSYDRTQRLMYDCGFYDFLCLNGQVNGKIFMSYIHKHTTGLNVIELQRRIYKSIKSLPQIADEYKKWALKEIADGQAKHIIRKTLAEKMSKTVDGINTKVDELFELYQNEMQVTGANLFSLYQMATWVSTHGLTDDRNITLSANQTDKYRGYVIYMIHHPTWRDTLNS